MLMTALLCEPNLLSFTKLFFLSHKESTSSLFPPSQQDKDSVIQFTKSVCLLLKWSTLYSLVVWFAWFLCNFWKHL